MALSTYAQLQASVADWIDRDDLTTQIVDFIALAEAEFNRTLWVPEREDVVTTTTADETLALPTDFHTLRSLYTDEDPRRVLEQMPIADLRRAYSSTTATGEPWNFAIQEGNALVFGPAPDQTYSFILNYYKAIPALTDSATTNWLLTGHPDIYLYGSLLQAEAFMIDDPRIAVWAQKLSIAAEQLLRLGRKKAWSGAKRYSDLATGQAFNINRG